MPAPVFQAVGTLSNSSATSVNVSWPTHQTNDIGLLVIETTSGGGTLAPPSGWAAAPSTPVTAGGSKLHVWWKRAASNAEAAVATGFSNSDHVAGRIFTFRGCVTTGNPWDVTTTGVKTLASPTATVPAVTTTVADTLIVMIVGRPDDSNSTIHFGVPTNANLTGLAEAAESGYDSGNGGGFVVSYGTKTTAGDTGTSTLTKANSTTDTYVVIALKQPTTDYTLTADKATFNDTFVDAGLLYGRRFIGDAQSYALTGRDAGLNKGLSMPADRATFTLTGRDANFPRAYRLTADKATFTFTGRDAGLRAARRIAADTSAFTLTGQAAGALAGRRLTADARTYALTARDTNFLRGIRFPAATSAFTLTGYNVALTKTGSYALLASPQSYALTGRNANLAANLAASRRLTADARAFTVTGNAANLFASRRLTASLGTYTLAAYPVDLKRGYLRRRIIIF